MPDQSSIDARLTKLAALKEELQSDEHYQRTETVAYGEEDPFNIPLNRCDHCGGNPEIRRPEIQIKRWRVICTECKSTPTDLQRRPWQAALAWNSKNLARAHYTDIPFFGVGSLPPKEVTRRLNGIRLHLELLKRIAGLERSLFPLEGTRLPGKGYQERIEAYLHWAIYGLRLAKLATQQARNEALRDAQLLASARKAIKVTPAPSLNRETEESDGEKETSWREFL